MRQVRGIITPIVTPFTCGGSLDSEALKGRELHMKRQPVDSRFVLQ